MKKKYSLNKEGGLIVDCFPKDIIHRYEKIRTRVYQTETLGVDSLADAVVEAINNHKEGLFKLGLTTGNSPLGLYRELVQRHLKGEVSFKYVTVYSIDELYPISKSQMQSRNFKIHEDLLDHIDILPENIHVIDGSIPMDDISEYCSRYDEEARNMDLLVVGVGNQGQLAFNDIGSYIKTKTRLVQLTRKARLSLVDLFSNPKDIPQMAITMGIDTIMSAKKILIMAWGEDKAEVIKKIVEGPTTDTVPASFLQFHSDIKAVVDKDAAQMLTCEMTPWLVGLCKWDRKFIREAVVWLCRLLNKPILELTYEDYIENSLGGLVESVGQYDRVNIDVFNDIQHTITGWPGGKPNADDSCRPVPATPFPKKVIIFSPHPDDDVISMGGTFHRLITHGHDVHVAYQTSGNVAVHDDVVLQSVDTAREIGLSDKYDYIQTIIESKVKGEPDPRELLDIKGGIRRAEAKAAVRELGLNDKTNAHFLNLPFYETGGIKKGELSKADIDIIIKLLREIKPDQIYAAGDLSDPHGTHRICIESILIAMEEIQDDKWTKNCVIWLYRGAWQDWDLGMVDMAVPLSPDELMKKRHAIYKHLSQKDIMPFPGEDKREFWERAEERTKNTACQYDKLGLAKYQAIELFVKMTM